MKPAARFLLLLLCCGHFGSAQPGHLKLWYQQPAAVWEQTLPLGNGRLGMTPDSGPFEEQIVLNDITLWSGSPQDANNYDAWKSLPEIRRLLMEGRNDEAQALVNKQFVCKGAGSGGAQWGKFQTMGLLKIHFDYEDAATTTESYLRRLDIDSAIASCKYVVNGISYSREYFTSFSGDVAIVRLLAERPGKLNLSISLDRAERSNTQVENGQLVMRGQLDNGTDGNGMRFVTRAAVSQKGGLLSANGDQLQISNASEVLIYVSAATSYKNPAFAIRADSLLEAAMAIPYEKEKAAHISRYRELFSRADIFLPDGSASALPTNERLDHFYQHPENDPSFAALFFQYGRYLSISSTRVGLLPPNLQGLWAKEVNTPWNGDYHLDVNVQMNHWPVEVSNLSELNLPLAELVKGLVIPGQRTAKAYYRADGWIAHVITNIWGFTEPGESASWGVANAGSGWLCNNLWEHYAFSLDKNYLEEIYPVLKGSAEFYRSVLVKDPKTGWLVTSPSVSPENAFYLPNGKTANVAMGPTIDNQIVRELFGNMISAAKILKRDQGFARELQKTLALIPPPGVISKSGRIQEWLEDYRETDLQHRHISHLYGLYPAALISPSATPELANAAKKTLETRGDDGPSWSIAYKLLFWARLADGNRSFKLLRELLKPTVKTDINYGAGGGVYPNLLSAGPPFQIDGNFGAEAGIAEMLVQSHEGFINLLPALPDAWKSEGSISGLRVRGNGSVDMRWQDGKVAAFQLHSPRKGTWKVKWNGVVKEVTATKE